MPVSHSRVQLERTTTVATATKMGETSISVKNGERSHPSPETRRHLCSVFADLTRPKGDIEQGLITALPEKRLCPLWKALAHVGRGWVGAARRANGCSGLRPSVSQVQT